MFVVGPPPDAAVIMIGANDPTAIQRHWLPSRNGWPTAYGCVTRGAVVVVGTCPDLGVITAIPGSRWVRR